MKIKTNFPAQVFSARLQNEINPLTAEKQTWGKFRDGDRVIVTQNNAYYSIWVAFSFAYEVICEKVTKIVDKTPDNVYTIFVSGRLSTQIHLGGALCLT